MTLKGFFKRRLIRLHPMIIMGAIIGCIAFFVQGGVKWDGTHVATSAVMLALLLAMCFIPAYPGAGYDVTRKRRDVFLERTELVIVL